MKTQFAFNGFVRAVRALSLSGTLLLATVAAATNTPASSPAGTNSASKQVAIEVPASQFVIPTSTSEGRDPFFPDSTRVHASAIINTNPGPKAPSAPLVLQGISVVGPKRFALINGRTFEVNEDADVSVGRAKVHVLCVSIKEDSVVVEVEGSRQELRLRPGL